MKPLTPILPLLALVASCADRTLLYTGTQVGFHVQGIKENIPDKASLGYDRSEFAWFPDGAGVTAKGSFDGEFSPASGLAIHETLATGEAAGGQRVDEGQIARQCMITSTNSKFNLGLEVNNSDGVSPSFNAAFKRSVLALLPKVSQGSDLPATYNDISIHTSGISNVIQEPMSVPSERRLKSNRGVRVVQTIATGRAATSFAQQQEKPIGDNTTDDIGKPSETR